MHTVLARHRDSARRHLKPEKSPIQERMASGVMASVGAKNQHD